jgi:hypothetical protein
MDTGQKELTNADSSKVRTVLAPRDGQEMCLPHNIITVLMENNTA